MTHEELLAKIDEIIEEYGLTNADVRYFYALRSVVELHKPVAVLTGGNTGTIYYNRSKLQCENCHGQYAKDIGIYPCPTIQAIEKELK